MVKGNRNNDEQCKLRRALDTRDIYIRDIDPDFVEADIKLYMKSSDVNVRAIRQILGRREGQKKSFKITILASDFEKTMNAEFWPKDIECREWYSEQQLRNLCEENPNN